LEDATVGAFRPFAAFLIFEELEVAAFEMS